jgi:lipopolysaccharide transport system permease protein
MTNLISAAEAPPRERLPSAVILPGSGTLDLRELWRFRDLFLLLTERDVRLRYRQTALGIAWVVLQPLVSSLIFAAVFGLFARLPSNGTPYLPFVFAAMLPWNLLAGGVQRAGNSLLASTNLVTKVYLPRAILPIAGVCAVLLDFAVALVVMFVLMPISGVLPSWTVLALPPLLALTLFVTIGVSLLFSALAVYYRDFSYALPFVIQVWMYASPVAYGSGLVPDGFQLLYGLNPMVGIIDGFRWALLGGALPVVPLVESVGVSTLMLLIGAAVFRRVERSFADVI